MPKFHLVLKIAVLCSNMCTMFYPDDISVFAFYLTMQVAQLPEHPPSQLTPLSPMIILKAKVSGGLAGTYMAFTCLPIIL